MKILNFGSLNIDYVYKVDHMTMKGETQLAASRTVYTGGKGLNQSVAMGRAGLPVFHAGNIGAEGRFLLEELRSAHVNTDNVRVLEDVPSGHTIIQNDRDGDNCILLYGGANQAVDEEQIEAVLEQFDAGDILVLQNEINELPEMMRRAHEKGMKIVFNPSPMNEAIGRLPLADVGLFLLNEIEASQLTGAPSGRTEDLIHGLRMRFPEAAFVLTLGADGSVWFDGTETIRQGIYKVETVDTTAAGDTFTGYFLAGILGGKTPADALRLAARASAIAVSREGAAPSIPTMTEVLENDLLCME